MKDMQAKKAKLDAMAAQATGTNNSGGGGGSSSYSGSHTNPFLAQPVQPEVAIQIYLMQFRQSARRYYQQSTGSSGSSSSNNKITTPFCEVEVRLGILQVQHAQPERRVTSSGAKHPQYKAYDCSNKSCNMVSGVNRTHYIRTTSVGISEVSAISQALNVNKVETLKRDIVEKEMIETVYTGYPNAGRVCFDGEHPASATTTVNTTTNNNNSNRIGKLESKEKLMTQDLTIPAANFDVRISLSSEKVLDNTSIINIPPTGWKSKRIKRRRSYHRADKTIAWQIDVTEVTTTENTSNHTNSVDTSSTPTIAYEIEFELLPSILLQLLNENDENMLKKMTISLAQQLWHIIMHMNPLKDALNVEEALQDHTNYNAVQLAIEQCNALRTFMDNGCTKYTSPIGNSNYIPTSNRNTNFIGCMPINFSRHNLDEIQRASDQAYYLSEKTDGVRHFMIFTGNTVVLIDRAMRGKQPKVIHPVTDSNSSSNSNTSPASGTEPFASIIDLIRPGTVLDGEVVMNRRSTATTGGSSSSPKPRPVFIVFDVLAISTTEPVLHLPFAQRLQHLRQASFRTPNASRDMFDARYIPDMSIPLPLVRKNFVKRTELDDLLNNVHEERGMRCYRSGELHNHLTDGIIFQPNLPYVCGTDVHLLKWKYLDTVTVDVEIVPPRRTDDENALRVACLGEEQTLIDMTRYVLLPQSERLRLEADRFEVGGTIAEVGFDPETGEWYYVTMRSDKVTPNHISTVLGTLLELAESLTTDELRYRMGIPAGTRDTYRKDMRGMFKQLLHFQRQKLQSQRAASTTNGTR
jgi:hypothetical protein